LFEICVSRLQKNYYIIYRGIFNGQKSTTDPENAINLEIEEFIELAQKFGACDQDLFADHKKCEEFVLFLNEKYSKMKTEFIIEKIGQVYYPCLCGFGINYKSDNDFSELFSVDMNNEKLEFVNKDLFKVVSRRKNKNVILCFMKEEDCKRFIEEYLEPLFIMQKLQE
jgi:hypothetical protein